MNMQGLIKLLHEGGYSCVVRSGAEIRTFTRRGVADLYGLRRDDPEFLRGASVADKVVGKGAAAVMAASGIAELYTDIISEPALHLLRREGIRVAASEVVPLIQNRDKSGRCPLETACMAEDSLGGLMLAVDRFMAERAVDTIRQL